jgi:hypothetical protein
MIVIFTIFDLESHFGKAQVEVNGITFNLLKDESLAGVLALWATPDYSYMAYATPDWEGVSLPIEVFVDYQSIGCEEYEHEIELFDDYITVVKVLLKRILDKYMGIIETINIDRR